MTTALRTSPALRPISLPVVHGSAHATLVLGIASLRFDGSMRDAARFAATVVRLMSNLTTAFYAR